MANKFSIDHDDFSSIIDKLTAMGEAQNVIEDALKATHGIVTPKAAESIALHHRTGRTAASLDTSPEVNWEAPWLASIDVGFHIRQGGLASIFLMYGTPRMKPDRKMHSVFFGSAVRNQIQDKQRDIFKRVLE